MTCAGFISISNCSVCGQQPLRGGSSKTAVCSGENFFITSGKTASTVEAMNPPLQIFRAAALRCAD